MSEHDWKPNPFADGWERCVGCGLALSPGSPVEARGGDCAAAQIAALAEDRRRLLERLRACTCGESAAAPRAVEPDYDTRYDLSSLTKAQADGDNPSCESQVFRCSRDCSSEVPR